jgi:DNA-directed RNA polymerase subunit RPC12/RpoP
MDPTCKTCTKCGEALPLSEFHRGRSECKHCGSKINAKNYQARKQADPQAVRKKYKINKQRRKRANPRGVFLTDSLSNCKARAKKNRWPFDLDKRWMEEKLDAGVCEITGQPLDLSFTFDRAPRSPSFHRRDSKGGYTKTNTKVVWFCINTFIGQMTPDEAFAVWRQANDGFLSQGFAICNHTEALGGLFSLNSPPSIVHAPSAGGQRVMDDDEWKSTILSVGQAGSMTDATSSRSVKTVTPSSIRARG